MQPPEAPHASESMSGGASGVMQTPKQRAYFLLDLLRGEPDLPDALIELLEILVANLPAEK